MQLKIKNKLLEKIILWDLGKDWVALHNIVSLLKMVDHIP